MKKDSHLERAVLWLESRQLPEGYWNAHLETNCCMEAQWLMACKFCGIESEKNAGIIDYIVNSQRADGSWDVYFGAENGDVNTTLECYYALRIFGFDKNAPKMKAARDWLLKYEWYKHVRVFTKYWLALFGEWRKRPLCRQKSSISRNGFRLTSTDSRRGRAQRLCRFAL